MNIVIGLGIAVAAVGLVAFLYSLAAIAKRADEWEEVAMRRRMRTRRD